MTDVPKVNCPEARICIYWLSLDRKHSEVSKTVKRMSVGITELIWQAKTLSKIHPEFLFLEVTDFFNACLWDLQIDRTQIAVPMASTRCLQSLERVSCLFFEKFVFVVFPRCPPFRKVVMLHASTRVRSSYLSLLLNTLFSILNIIVYLHIRIPED